MALLIYICALKIRFTKKSAYKKITSKQKKLKKSSNLSQLMLKSIQIDLISLF